MMQFQKIKHLRTCFATLHDDSESAEVIESNQTV